MTGGWKDCRTDDGWGDGWTDGWTDRCINELGGWIARWTDEAPPVLLTEENSTCSKTSKELFSLETLFSLRCI